MHNYVILWIRMDCSTPFSLRSKVYCMVYWMVQNSIAVFVSKKCLTSCIIFYCSVQWRKEVYAYSLPRMCQHGDSRDSSKVILIFGVANINSIRGHPFMTYTRRDGGRGSSSMWTSTQKIKIRVHWRHPVFFSCKEVGVFFTRISSLDGIKCGNFSAI